MSKEDFAFKRLLSFSMIVAGLISVIVGILFPNTTTATFWFLFSLFWFVLLIFDFVKYRKTKVN